ncbi:hypothetical protein PIB30_063223 [Stylosanthes scabra]|uniref:Uncharacterized protein n=1 Tax=Stylosanthes scabra TaxID=79078 RepID=A0ABU6RLS2_9FABA|nr:hypothetical protein [Stylosanthes scabra]
MLPELHREIRLTADRAAEKDYVLEAAGPSNRLPFRALEDRTHYLWVYTELFTRLGVQFPFSEFHREAMTRCQVAASQLHLNGWGVLRTFERVCLRFGFRPSSRVFLYIYQVHAPPPGKGFISFRAIQDRKLFARSRSPSKSLSGTMSMSSLFLVGGLFGWMMGSLPVGLGKKSKFKCRWILDHSDAEIARLADMDKQSRFDRLLAKMAAVEGVGPRSILPAPSSTSVPATPVSTAVPVGNPPPSSFVVVKVPSGASSGVVKTRRKASGTTSLDLISLDREETAQENPFADLKQKRRKRKVVESIPGASSLGPDSAWDHGVDPIDRAFPEGYDFRADLNAGLTRSAIREILDPMAPDQLLGSAQFLACKLTTCLQVGIEKTFAVKVGLEKELTAAKDQVEELTAERDSALAAPLFTAKIKSLTADLELAEGERLSALARMKEVEEAAKVQAAELESCRLALEREQRKTKSLNQSLEQKQKALGESEAAVTHWGGEWKDLAEETREMVRETFEILMDQVRHLNPDIDYSMIMLTLVGTLRPIYNPKAEGQEQLEPIAEDLLEHVAEDQPDATPLHSTF